MYHWLFRIFNVYAAFYDTLARELSRYGRPRLSRPAPCGCTPGRVKGLHLPWCQRSGVGLERGRVARKTGCPPFWVERWSNS